MIGFDDNDAFDPYNDEILHAIGFLLVTCGQVEGFLPILVMRMIHGNHPFHRSTPILLQGMAFKATLEKIKLLASYFYKPHYKEIAKRCEGIEEIFAKRNLFAHGALLKPQDREHVVVTSMKLKVSSGKMPEAETFTAEQIRSMALELRQRIMGLYHALTAAGIPPLEKGKQIPIPPRER